LLESINKWDDLRENFNSKSDFEEYLATQIVDAAVTVHKRLGPGLLEKIYEVCLCYELEKRGLKVRRQVKLPIFYDNLVFEEGLILDLLVEDLVICELKAVDAINPYWQAQIISHLKLAKLRLGFLINFNVDLMKNGINRFVV
jgi:GxxExxY protein